MATRRRLRTLGACVIAALVSSCDDPIAPDTSPPAAVTDLLAGMPTATSIRLTWTAPGDDATSGRATQYDVRHLNAPITDANWSAALPVDAQIRSPKSAGEAEVLVVENLEPGQEYCFALRTCDEASNWSPLSNVTTLSTFDLEPPGAITDLVVQSVGDFEVTLAWTAPGDDGSLGRADAYEIRYSELPITENSWASAPEVSDPPTPAPAGFGEAFQVTGLSRLTTYYFAVRAVDEAHSLGGLSNVVHCTTTFVPRDEGELVDKLSAAYSRRDYDLFTSLFPAPGDPSYIFILYAPQLGDPPNWNRTEELRIHRRMFEPENVPPGEMPVVPELWLQAIHIVLSPAGSWTERPDLYQSPSNPDGLDPVRWRVTEAQYHASIFWDTQSQTDYRVDGRQNFIVVDDLTKSTGESGKFALYRWEDLGSAGGLAVEEVSWSNIKGLYRK